MAKGSGFTFGAGQIAVNLAELDAKMSGYVSAVVDYHGTQGEAQMKVQAPWTDQTGAARAGLNAQSSEEFQRRWVLVLAHAVNYGIWLETRNDFNGRYAIILPVLVDTGNRLMQSLEGLFGKVE